MRIDDEAQQRSSSRKTATIGEERIVSDHRSDADQNRSMLMSQQLDMCAGFVAGDPSTCWSASGKTTSSKIIWRRRNLAVQSHGGFQSHKRQVIADVFGECIIQWPSFF